MDKFAENSKLKYFYVKRSKVKKTYYNYKGDKHITVKF